MSYTFLKNSLMNCSSSIPNNCSQSEHSINQVISFGDLSWVRFASVPQILNSRRLVVLSNPDEKASNTALGHT